MAPKTPTASARVQAGQAKSGTGKAPTFAKTQTATGAATANKATGGAAKVVPTEVPTAASKTTRGKVPKK
ncbi:hypothetical protein DXG03_008304 [Asterophora parasitica]|uniref:Uncharacterized protein n=1 Tax=Asterophora parasitica TaxID=117018 RepID=A0A9P7G5K0_9AGAR|nr:hypothetical protein DXG03_008304 [Asterophora parasitica]